MGAYFSQSDGQQAKMWLERRWYTAGPLTLQPGPNPIFVADNWTDPQFPVWLARLRRIAATQNANVQLSWGFDKQTQNASQKLGWTDAMPANLQPLKVDAPAVSTLNLTAYNTSASAITLYQLNYQIEMKRLSVAEKLLYGYGLTALDQDVLTALGVSGSGETGIQQVQNLLRRGSIPLSIDEQLARYIGNQRLSDETASGTFHTTAGSNTAGTPFANLQVKSGQVLIVTEIAFRSGAAAVLFVDRDGDIGYETLTGAAFAQTNPDYAWDVFIPAKQLISLRAYAATSTPMSVDVRVERYNLSDILKVMFGYATSPGSVGGKTYAQILAGIN